jgi:6-phosphogluconolactonase
MGIRGPRFAATGNPKKLWSKISTEVRVLKDADELAVIAARLVADIAAAAVARPNQNFAVALSGGSTPRRLHDELARIEALDWSKWEVFWGDERWVPPGSPESNLHMAQETLLSKVDVPEEQVHPVPTNVSAPAEAAELYSGEVIRFLGPDPVFDLVLLGLGTDGHTASLFPETDVLDEHERVVAANWVPHLRTHRITLTFPTINRANHIMFVVSGADKASMVRKVLEPGEDVDSLPATGIRPATGILHWLLDREAASELSALTASSR